MIGPEADLGFNYEVTGQWQKMSCAKLSVKHVVHLLQGGNALWIKQICL